MIFAKLLKKNQAQEPKTFEAVYAHEIERRIRERYSLSAELAILRQRETKTEEYNEYFRYAEQCKAEVKAELGIVEG